MNEKSVEFFQSQIKAIEDELYGSGYNKSHCIDSIGRLRGAISYAYYVGNVSPDELSVYEQKYKEYVVLSLNR